LNSSSVSTKLLVLPLTGTKPEDSKAKECGGDFATYSDEMLLSLVQAGEQEALGCLFRRYARIAHGIGKRILCDEAEAEDLVQDVFLYIHRKSGLYNPAKGRASSWIIQTVYYQALQRRMRLTAGHDYSTHEVQGGSDPMLVASSTVERDHSAEVIFGRSTWQGILKTLTEDQWETLRMHFFEGYTLGEIAEKRGQPVGNTRHHFYRGLEALRKQVFATDLSRREKNKVKCSLNVIAEDR
jgi:RNA polymerase sigma-70 factor (ECF subfamily)